MPADSIPDVALILLAAGAARRFGALKQLQLLGGQSLVRRAAEVAQATGLPVTVVTGAQSGRVAEALQDLSVHELHNADWAQGLGGSLALAVRTIRAASPSPAAVLILLADQPFVRTDDLHAILREHAAHPDAIVTADYGADVLGPPCLFPSRWFDALVALQGDRGARALRREHRASVRTLPMPDAGVDVDTPEDLAKAEARLR